jgi:hypothetical protein
VEDLPVKVGELHLIVIHDTQDSNARRCEVESSRTAQTSGPDHQGPSLAQADLSFSSQVGDHDLAAVPLNLFGIETNGESP